MARLTNDGSQLGPGAYNVATSSKALAASPKGGVKWGYSRSKRGEHFVKTTTQKDVGPGKYSPRAKIDRTINNPTIPRADNKAKTSNGKFKRAGMMADPLDDEDEDNRVEPGPGEYLQSFQTTQFGQNAILHEYPQNFGTTVGRFKDKPVGCELGPGRYLSIDKQQEQQDKQLP